MDYYLYENSRDESKADEVIVDPGVSCIGLISSLIGFQVPGASIHFKNKIDHH